VRSVVGLQISTNSFIVDHLDNLQNSELSLLFLHLMASRVSLQSNASVEVIDLWVEYFNDSRKKEFSPSLEGSVEYMSVN
jgi:hypothetical protein